MRKAQVISDFFEWRWAPCVGLTVASLAWVGLAVLIIPNQLESSAHASSGTTAFNAPALPNTAFNSALTQSAFTSPPAQPIRRAIPPPAPAPVPTSNDPAGAVVRRGFSPPIEQPEAPPPPPPVVVQAPPPVPAPPVAAAPVPNLPAQPAVAPPAAPPNPPSGEDANQPAPAPPQ